MAGVVIRSRCRKRALDLLDALHQQCNNSAERMQAVKAQQSRDSLTELFSRARKNLRVMRARLPEPFLERVVVDFNSGVYPVLLNDNVRTSTTTTTTTTSQAEASSSSSFSSQSPVAPKEDPYRALLKGIEFSAAELQQCYGKDFLAWQELYQQQEPNVARFLYERIVRRQAPTPKDRSEITSQRRLFDQQQQINDQQQQINNQQQINDQQQQTNNQQQINDQHNQTYQDNTPGDQTILHNLSASVRSLQNAGHDPLNSALAQSSSKRKRPRGGSTLRDRFHSTDDLLASSPDNSPPQVSSTPPSQSSVFISPVYQQKRQKLSAPNMLSPIQQQQQVRKNKKNTTFSPDQFMGTDETNNTFNLGSRWKKNKPQKQTITTTTTSSHSTTANDRSLRGSVRPTDSVVRRGGRRRRRRRWTPEEVESLKDGVRRYGKGAWSNIIRDPNLYFQDRTGSDLKDKWRNLELYGHVDPNEFDDASFI